MRFVYAIATALAIAFAATNGTAQASPCNRVYHVDPGKSAGVAYARCLFAHAPTHLVRPE